MAHSYYKVGINLARLLFLKKKCEIILDIKKKAILLCVVSVTIIKKRIKQRSGGLGEWLKPAVC